MVTRVKEYKKPGHESEGTLQSA